MNIVLLNGTKQLYSIYIIICCQMEGKRKAYRKGFIVKNNCLQLRLLKTIADSYSVECYDVLRF